jgi:hypothetical protein
MYKCHALGWVFTQDTKKGRMAVRFQLRARLPSLKSPKNQKAKGSASALPFAHTRRFGVSGLVVAGAPYDRQQDKQHQHQSKIVKKIAIEQTHSLSLLYRQLPILYEADVSFDWTEAHG